jgi:hypothetical protein
MKISEKYRNKALACEKLGKEAKDHEIRCAWADIAIEWHSLASRIAQEVGQDCDIEVSLESWRRLLQLEAQWRTPLRGGAKGNC